MHYSGNSCVFLVVQLLSAPLSEAKDIVRRRFPVPKIVDCDHNTSQVRS